MRIKLSELKRMIREEESLREQKVSEKKHRKKHNRRITKK